MSQKSKIEWTDATWNPVRGCSRVSEGCRNCYAERIAARFNGFQFDGMAADSVRFQPFSGFAEMTKAGPRWTGKVELIESALDAPLHWKKPRRIFVNSISDLFHESLPDEAIDHVFAVMALCPRHTFQVLTKRAERMREYFRDKALLGGDPQNNLYGRILYAVNVLRGKFPEKHLGDIPVSNPGRIPLRNLWLGVSCENQETADERIPLLLQTPAAVRFVSLEPLLGSITLNYLQHRREVEIDALNGTHGVLRPHGGTNNKLDQVIVGGESGPGARPMNPDWVRSIRDQCVAAGVPFFFKQWGEYAPTFAGDTYPKYFENVPANDGTGTHHRMFRVGKKAAGCLLDGRTWDEGPALEGLDALDALKQAIRDCAEWKREHGTEPWRRECSR